MNKMFSAIAFLFVGNVMAAGDIISCEQYGYTNNPDNFFDMEVTPRRTVFEVGVRSISLNGTKFSVVDPNMYDLSNIAVVYKDSKNNQLLYLYKNELGEKEVGISYIEDDSDTFFEDKSVYKQCTLIEGEEYASAKQVLRAKSGRAFNAVPIYSF